MAKLFSGFPCVATLTLTMVQAGLLQLILVVASFAERCTRAVPRVQTYPAKKVHVLRRVPATCSNWDKAWAWLTKVDCGTKYRLDYVTVPPREVKQYKLQYVCCDGDTDCKEAENIHSSGFDSTDEKFLAVVLGSTAACVVIIIIIFAITFYTKKTRCLTICDHRSHIYASADGEESQDGTQDEKCQPEDLDSETDQKACEAEYAEIGDSRLPRYHDIFNENREEKKGDPFNNASAPPMYSEVTPKSYVNAAVRAPPSLHSSAVDEIQVVQAASPTYSDGADEVFEGPRHHHHQQQQHGGASHDGHGDVKYYNVQEKKRRKKRSVNSQGSSTSSSAARGERRVARENSGSSSSRSSSRRSKASAPVAMEMMVKSSSASETIGRSTETSLTKHKRRSAPPGSVDVAIGVIHNCPGPNSCPSSSAVSRSYSSNTCTVIHEAPPPRSSSEKRQKRRLSKEGAQQKPARKTIGLNEYENKDAGATTAKPNTKDVITSSIAETIPDITDMSGSISPSNGAVLTCCDSACTGLASIESASPQPSEKDSLLRTPSCHSGCGSDRGFEDCEHCARYDRLQHASDSDAASLHVYQCLEDVKQESQRLKASASASMSLPTTPPGGVSPSRSDAYVNGEAVRGEDCVDIHNDSSSGQNHIAHC